MFASFTSNRHADLSLIFHLQNDQIATIEFASFATSFVHLRMNRRNSWIGILSIAVVLIGLFWFLTSQNRDSTLSPTDTAFALEDTAAVTAIRLIQTQEGKPLTTIDLRKNAEGIWIVNQTYRAFEPQIGYLLTTLHRLQVKEVLTGNGLETAEKVLHLMNTRVEIEGPQGPIKTYLLGTSARDSKGSLMKLEGASQPFIVERPDLQGFINPFFTIDVDIWRERLLWRATAAELREIRIEWPANPEKNLWLATSPEQPWTIQPGGETPDAEKLATYLELFQGAVFAESFAARRDPEQFGQLQEKVPDIKFSLSYADGRQREVVLYLRSDNLNSYFGWVTGEEELYTIQHYVFDDFLLSNSDLLTDPS